MKASITMELSPDERFYGTGSDVLMCSLFVHERLMKLPERVDIKLSYDPQDGYYQYCLLPSQPGLVFPHALTILSGKFGSFTFSLRLELYARLLEFRGFKTAYIKLEEHEPKEQDEQ